MKAKWMVLAMGFGLIFGFAGVGQTQKSGEPINISSSNTACVFAFDCRPALATRDGEVFVVWAQEVGDGQSTLYFSKSTDDGETFDDPKAIEVSAAAQAQQPALALDSNDNLIVAWADNRSGDFDIFMSLSKDKGNTWSWDDNEDYVDLSENDGDSLDPALISINGGIVAAWSDDTSDDALNPGGARNIFLKASLNPALVQVQAEGFDFSSRTESINVSKRFFSSPGSPAEHPMLAVSSDSAQDPFPDVFIVWQQKGIQDEEIYFHETPAFNPVNVSNFPNSISRRPVIAVRHLNDVLSRKQVVIAWVEQVGSDSRILSNSTTQAGLFLNPVEFSNFPLQVSDTSELAIAPALAVNEQGDFFIVWESQDFSSRDPSEIKLRSLSNAFSPTEAVSQRSDVLNRDATNPAVVADDNNIYVAWVDQSRAVNEADIFFAKRPVRLFGL